jgi:hypothetical protein
MQSPNMLTPLSYLILDSSQFATTIQPGVQNQHFSFRILLEVGSHFVQAYQREAKLHTYPRSFAVWTADLSRHPKHNCTLWRRPWSLKPTVSTDKWPLAFHCSNLQFLGLQTDLYLLQGALHVSTLSTVQYNRQA